MKLETRGVKVFRVFNVIILTVVSLLCLLPFLNVMALSFSDKIAVAKGEVIFWPVNFSLDSYHYVLDQKPFWRAFLISLERVALGGGLGIFLTVLCAYPLSKSNQVFRFRTVYVWYFFITMLFSGGLISGYVVVTNLGLKNTIWALVLPGAVSAYNILLMLNFYRQLPGELEEAAFIDGAGHFKTWLHVYLPCSVPSIATIALFTIVGQWNAWFDGIIYMSKTDLYPLQSYLQTIVTRLDFQNMTVEELKRLSALNQRSLIAAQMVIAMVPILCLYPFLQKHFVSGIVLGSVKG